jgi:hypothetical protein
VLIEATPLIPDDDLTQARIGDVHIAPGDAAGDGHL